MPNLPASLGSSYGNAAIFTGSLAMLGIALAWRRERFQKLKWPSTDNVFRFTNWVGSYAKRRGWRVTSLDFTSLRVYVGKTPCHIRCVTETGNPQITFLRDVSEFVRAAPVPAIIVCRDEPSGWFKAATRSEFALAIWYKDLRRLDEWAVDAAALRDEFVSSRERTVGNELHPGSIGDVNPDKHDSITDLTLQASSPVPPIVPNKKGETVVSSPVEVLEYVGHQITVSSSSFLGAVDNAFVTMDGVSFTAWAISDPSTAGEPIPPAVFLVYANGKLISETAPNTGRPDIASKFGENTRKCGLKLSLPPSAIPEPFMPDFTFFACDGIAKASRLPVFAANDRLKPLQIRSGSEFMRLIQTPSTRLTDYPSLGYTAAHCLDRFNNDFSIQAAALCVIGYRLLNREIEDARLTRLFLQRMGEALAREPDIDRGLFLRWHTSLRLIAGYIAYQAGNDHEALEHFSAIVPFYKDLATWPQAMTNILLGVFISGYLLMKSGRVDDAIEQWSRSTEIFRAGCAVAEFQNYYAYGEVGNALRVAQECYVALMVARGSGPLNAPSIAPPGTDLDLARLPSPFGRLVTQRNSP